MTTYILILPALTMTKLPSFTADSESSEDWEASFSDVSLSGNLAADLLRIARSQLGYKESENNYIELSAFREEEISSSPEEYTGSKEDEAAGHSEAAEEYTESAKETARSDSSDNNSGKTEDAETPDAPENIELASAGELENAAEAEAVASKVSEENSGEDANGAETVTKGYTRYGAWYGEGYEYEDWSALFVSFCLSYAGASEEFICPSADCRDWIEAFSQEYGDIYREAGSGYVPSPGDLIFFDSDGDGSPERVGIAAGLSGEYWANLSQSDLKEILAGSIDSLINNPEQEEYESSRVTLAAIEGDCADAVTILAYPLGSASIMGYAEMAGYTYDGLSNALSLLLEDVSGYGDAAESNDELISLCKEGRGRLLSMDNASLALYETENITDEEFASLEELSDSIDAELTSLENISDGLSSLDVSSNDGASPASSESIPGNDVQAASYDTEPDGASEDDIMTTASDLNTAYKQLVTFSGQGTTKSASYSLEVNTGDTWQLVCSVDNATWSISSNTNSSVASAYVSGNNIIIEALSEGSTTVIVTATVNRVTYTITATLTVNNSFDLKSTFTSYRYYHLDLKVVADFTIYVYDSATGSIQAVTPTDVKVTSVAAKIYNTSANPESPTYNASADTWSSTTSMSNYNANDTYNGMTVASYEVNWNTSPTYDENNSTYEYQSVGGHSGATSSSAALRYYDGDTVVLTVTIQYTYNGKTYTQDLEVTYTVCEYYNICSSASSTGDMRGFDINVAALDVNEIAATRIQKVDQYGNPVTGAVFALYTTSQDGNYYYLIDGDGETAIYADLSSATYSVDSSTGVISDIEGATYYTYSDDGTATEYSGSVTNVTITPRLTARTDSDGYFTFVYPDDYSQEELRGVSMTMSDLKAVYGEYFILREIDAPDGYLIVSEEMRMHIAGTGTTLLLECENQIESGVTTNPIIMVMATKDYLVKADPTGEYADDKDGNNWAEQEGHKIEYIETHDDSSVSINGTLFVVILKKGSRDPENETIDTWYPVYGDDEDGYTILNYEEWYEGDSEDTYVKQLSAAIYAAKQQLALNGGSTDGLVFALGDSGNVTLTISSLPGSVKEYYNYIQKINAADSDPANDSIEALRAESEYFAGYYYTTADSLEGATIENTTRVMSRSGLTEDYGGFTIIWGSSVNVTDYENVIYFQKVDDGRNFVNGAVFALYEAGEDSEGKLYYIADENGTAIYLGKDTLGTGEGVAVVGGATGSYKVNAETGVITVTVSNGGGMESLYTITPTRVGTTATMAGEDGTGSFRMLSEGYYVFREVFAPDPFVLNTTEVKIYVGSDGTYANAGEADDGVIVGFDPGYLSESFSGFASEGDINQTLSYIYTTLMLNYSDTFADLLASLDDGWSFVSPGSETAGAGEKVDSLSEAIVTYLVYSYSGENVLFNYVANSNQDARSAAGEAGSATLSGQGSRRLWTDENWAKLAIYQDYAYGKDNAGNATYEDLTSYGDISHLYSPSLYIRVTDDVTVDVEIEKVNQAGSFLDGAEFYLYYEETEEEKNEAGETSAVTSRYYYSYTENADGDESAGGGTVSWLKAEQSTDSEGNISWTVPDEATKLSTSSAGTDGDGNETTVYGTIHIYGLTSALSSVYWLEEVASPDGYQPLTSLVKINVNGATVTVQYGDSEYTESSADISGWKVGKAYIKAAGLTGFEDGVTYYTYDSEAGTYNKVEDGAEFNPNVVYYVRDDYTWVITVPNSNGERLPATGGAGENLPRIMGVVLILTAAAAHLIRKRKRASK